MSKILYVPDKEVVVPLTLLDGLASEATRSAPTLVSVPAISRGGSPLSPKPFDLEAYIASQKFDVDGPRPWSNAEGVGRSWTFVRSPMCDHHDGRAWIGELGNGAVQAGCLHNSCSWTWNDLRGKYGTTDKEAELQGQKAELPEPLDSRR